MKILDLINEAETDAAKNIRHTKDLDDLERDIRKSGKMDKDTEDAINKKRRELAANKARISETTTAGAIAAVPGAGFASGGIGTIKRATNPVKKNKKKNKR